MKLTSLIGGLGMMWLGSIQADEPAVANAYAREMPPGVMSTAVYLSINNSSDKAVTLINVSSPSGAKVMVHQNIIQGDMMRMRVVTHLEVAAHSQFDFAPGGHHLMVMGLSKSLQAGASLDLEFQFDRGQVIEVSVPVLNTADGSKQFSAHKSIEIKVQD
ncbi:MAG: copper chaperone PCu(A)C [Pseudomonadales bacterium]